MKLAAAADNVFSGAALPMDVPSDLDHGASLADKLQRVQQMTLPGTTVLSALRKMLIAFLLIDAHHGPKSHKPHKQGKGSRGACWFSATRFGHECLAWDPVDCL